MNVVWRPVAGYEGFYEVSTEGQVRRIAAGKGARLKVLKNRDRRGGYYLTVNLCRDGVPKDFYVHALVATAFHGACPPLHEVNHKDTNKKNNHADNLEWVTKGGNQKHTYRMGVKHYTSGWDGRHCKNGHLIAQTTLQLKDGKRECRVCRNSRRRAHYALEN